MNAAAVAALVGRPVVRVAPLGGAYRVWLASGGEVVAKRHAQASAVLAEVAGLRWLASGPPPSRSLRSEPSGTGSLPASTDSSGASDADREHVHPPNPNESPIGAPGGPPESTLLAGTDRSEALNADREHVHPPNPSESPTHAPWGPPDSTLPGSTDSGDARGGGCPQVPAVVGFDDEWLVIEAVPAGRASSATAERFGRELAALHQAGADSFGVAPPGGPVDAWIGLAPMRNATGARWPEWYAEHRVLPYLRTAVDQGSLHDPAPIESVCDRIVELAGPSEPLRGCMVISGVATCCGPIEHGSSIRPRMVGIVRPTSPCCGFSGVRTSIGSLPPMTKPPRLPMGGGSGLGYISCFRCLSILSCSAAGTGRRPSPRLGL